MQEKIVFFEELSSAYDSIFNTYIKNDFSVYCFSIDEKYRRKQKIKKYLGSKKLIDVSSIVFEYTLYRKAAFFAHENIEHIFNKYFSSIPSIKNMVNLLDFPEIVIMYKKELLLDIGKLYEIELKINEITKSNNSSDETHFIPRSGFNIHSDDSSPLDKNIVVINYTNLRIKLKNAFERLFTDDIKSPKKGILPLFYPIYLLFKKFKGVSKNIEPKEFKVGITIVRHPKSMFFLNYFTNTILIHDTEFPKEDVLFIDENGSKNLEGYKKRGYNFTRLDYREVISTDLFWNKIVKRFLPVWFKTLFLSLSKEPIFIDTKRRILQDYILWNIFAENYKIKNYMRRSLPDTISKIQILSQHSIKTWFVYPDNSSADCYLDWDESMKNHALFSFMYYDNAIIYGNKVERFFKKHRNKIKEYKKIGVIYSQIVNELQDEKLKSILPSVIRNKKLPKKIIGVFDTSYGNSTPLNVKDGFRFGNDILRLLEEFPDIGIVFKAKKELELTPFLDSVYDKLKNHERCVFFARYDKERISAPEVIAVSDLVISAAYTSTSGEALGARQKAIYYDVPGKNLGEKFYYNNYPNFVAHSYEELKKLINYWLFEVTDEEFEDFLNTYVRDEIDPYLDGKALTRLRKLLMEG